MIKKEKSISNKSEQQRSFQQQKSLSKSAAKDKQKKNFNYEVIYENKLCKGKMFVNKNVQLSGIKKRLIKKLGYQEENSSRALLQIKIYVGSYSPYYVTIQSDKNFQYIIERQLRQEPQQSITFKIINTNTHEKFTGMHHENKIQFDSDGSIQELDVNLDIIAPTNPPVDSKLNVKCVFCQKNQRDKEILKQCGRFYGPFAGSYFHLLCGIWCPEIFMTEEGELTNVEEQIKRSKNIFCALCGQKGAGLGCAQSSCKTSTHYLCTVKAQYEMNWNSYTFYCSSKCKRKMEECQSIEQNKQSYQNMEAISRDKNIHEKIKRQASYFVDNGQNRRAKSLSNKMRMESYEHNKGRIVMIKTEQPNIKSEFNNEEVKKEKGNNYKRLHKKHIKSIVFN